MAVQEFLDLPRIDVLTAPDHHVLDAADDVAVAVAVDRGEIAGMHPAAGIDRLRGFLHIVPVTLHDGIAARAKLARFARRDDAAFGIDDLHFDVGVDAADRAHALLQRVVGRSLEADRTGLRHAVADGHVAHMHLTHDALHHLCRTRRTRHDAGAQRA